MSTENLFAAPCDSPRSKPIATQLRLRLFVYQVIACLGFGVVFIILWMHFIVLRHIIQKPINAFRVPVNYLILLSILSVVAVIVSIFSFHWMFRNPALKELTAENTLTQTEPSLRDELEPS